MKPLRLVLCFHLNQTLLPYAYVASRACYRGLLAVLQRHPRLPVALHLSGTLIHAMRWLDPSVLQQVEAGLAAGQFELLGSTYAQNVPYASDDADNRIQAALHREVLQRTWDVVPRGFWNAERCWRPSLAPLIVAAGYRYTFVEDGFKREAGVVPWRVHELLLTAPPSPPASGGETATRASPPSTLLRAGPASGGETATRASPPSTLLRAGPASGGEERVPPPTPPGPPASGGEERVPPPAPPGPPASGGEEGLPYAPPRSRGGRGGHGLTLLCDDQELKHRFNLAMWTGRRRPLLAYLESLHEQQGEESWVVAYAEDGEACGLWGYERGLLPQAHWALLDQLLGELEQIPWLQVILPETTLEEEATPIPALPDGQASWMVTALHTPGAPYHEDGYVDWFDFQTRSPRLVHVRGVYEQVRRRLQQVEEKAASAAACRLVKLAWRAYAAHQYEFGCIGIGAENGVEWDGVRQALVLARAAEEADQADPHPRRWSEDVNEDGQDELFLADGRTLAIFSPLGGRLLYAFDLSAGQCWVGNPGQEPDWGFPWDEHSCPRRGLQPRPWLPGSEEPDLAPFAHMAARGDPRHLLRHLLPNSLLDHVPPETLLPQRPLDGLPTPGPLPAGRRALNESLWVDGVLVLASSELGEARWADAGPALVMGGRYGALVVEKRIALDQGALAASYRLLNRGPRLLQIVLEVEDELCPDALTLLDGGKQGLAAVALAPVLSTETRSQPDWERGAGQTILNRVSGAAVHLQSHPAPAEVATELVIGALVVRRSFRLQMEAGEERVVQLLVKEEGGTNCKA